MVTLKALADYTDALLDSGSFSDYAPNGLQVEGRDEVRTLVTGVTASLLLLDAAIEADADAVLVHHGYFWKGEDPRVTGIKRRRLEKLLGSGVSLLAYHLPLDAHPELGNNAGLAAQLDLVTEGGFGNDGGMQLGRYGRLSTPMTGAELSAHIASRLGREPLHLEGGSAKIETLGWCTGAAQSYIEAALEQGLDAFVSGEVSEQTVHIAKEGGIHYFAAGHHATERYGVQLLGAHLAAHFGIRHRFIDIDNPV